MSHNIQRITSSMSSSSTSIVRLETDDTRACLHGRPCCPDMPEARLFYTKCDKDVCIMRASLSVRVCPYPCCSGTTAWGTSVLSTPVFCDLDEFGGIDWSPLCALGTISIPDTPLHNRFQGR